eukprot:TRINITY_DN17266_c0_g1_i1.p1 TRINITY_DN17266_c0_g1~~TRINITY_DN17266_c0_g1_i1.p1  ORF type:complete len:255 (+),score=79.19 TRINITY_DN17266_c0_g1_i1:609-1373(+)
MSKVSHNAERSSPKIKGEEKDDAYNPFTKKALESLNALNVKDKENEPEKNEIDFKYVQKLEEKYNKLKTIRLTEPERIAKEIKQTFEQKRAVDDSLMEQIKQENIELLKQLSETKPASKKVDQLQARIEELEKENERLRNSQTPSPRNNTTTSSKHNSTVEPEKIISFFESMTTFQVILTGENRYLCSTQAGKQMRFEITVRDEVEYVPISVDDTLQTFHEWLKEPITFELSQLPVFFAKVLTSTLAQPAQQQQ